MQHVLNVWQRLSMAPENFLRDPLHNSGGAVAVGSGWAARRLFAANSKAIGKKSNAVDRPSPADHRPQRVMQRVLRVCTDAAQPLCRCLLALVNEIKLTACFYSENALATAPSRF